MPTSEQPAPNAERQTVITPAGILRGMRDMAPVALFVVPYGLAFGLAAANRGLDAWLATFISAAAFAGGSQFAALDLWAEPLPVFLILITVLLVNARHLLYGAALYPWLASLPAYKRYPIMAMMTDTSWAYTAAAIRDGERDADILLGSGLGLWLVWVVSTWAGVKFGAGLGDPRTYGLDVVMVGFFAATLVSMWRGSVDLAPWIAAAAAGACGVWLLPFG